MCFRRSATSSVRSGTPQIDSCAKTDDAHPSQTVVDTAHNVVKIPAGVLFRRSDDWYAYLSINGAAKLQRVAVGKTNGLETEITEGLSPGDIVLLHPTDKIQDGTLIHTAH